MKKSVTKRIALLLLARVGERVLRTHMDEITLYWNEKMHAQFTYIMLTR